MPETPGDDERTDDMTRYKINSAVLAFVISFSLTAATLIATAVPIQSVVA